ncbi:MAG TPA: acetate--CoA ligase family protein [Woeseiaceae bacterium]
MSHRLDPLLRPKSIAVVGASARAGTIGQLALFNLLQGKYPGQLYPVNPGYEELQGLACYPSLESLPETPDLVIFGVGDSRIEAAIDDAIIAGVKAAVIMSTLVIDDDTDPPLKERVAHKLRSAGMLACGGNGMGFYNIRDRVWACGFDARTHTPPGNVALLSHSGSGMCGIVDCEERIDFNFAASTGQELTVSMDEYLDFVLDLPETRVVGLFVETARNPENFVAALQKAQSLRIPVVALKVGRTRRAAELTVSHSGAMAGDDDTYDALFDRYGVQRVADMDELATTLILFSQMNPVGPGGLVCLHDSGGERQLMVDLADAAGVELTDLNADTVSKLEHVLDPELPAVNPLDAWSRGGANASEQMAKCLAIMMSDPNTAVGAVIHDRAPHGTVYPNYVEYMHYAHAATGKPAALVAARQGTGCDPLVVTSTRNGLPVLDGVAQFLTGMRKLFDYRDFLERAPLDIAEVPQRVANHWPALLKQGRVLNEAESSRLLRDFGVNANACSLVDNEAQLLEAARDYGYPIVLKTAMPGITHKTDQGGVVLGIGSEQELRDAYGAMRDRLGPRALLAPMLESGVEMILGTRRDPQFGPVIMLGFGGIHAELIKDVRFALPPFDWQTAERLLAGLKMRKLLDGARGMAPADVRAFCDMAAKFSVMVDALRDYIQEIDINPVIVTASGATAVDALVVTRAEEE